MGEKETTTSAGAARMKAGLDSTGGALATGAARQAPARDLGEAAADEPGPGDQKHIYQHNQTDLDFVR